MDSAVMTVARLEKKCDSELTWNYFGVEFRI